MKLKLAFAVATFFVAITCLAQTLVERTFVMHAETTTVDSYTGMTHICVLVYADGKYRMERSFQGITGSASNADTKIYLDTIPEADFKTLGTILDDTKFVAIKTPPVHGGIVKDMDTLLVSIPREHEVQNIGFNNAAERKPFEKDLNPFMSYLKNLEKRKVPAARAEQSNNCVPSGGVPLRTSRVHAGAQVAQAIAFRHGSRLCPGSRANLFHPPRRFSHLFEVPCWRAFPAALLVQ